jgi:hypothetical protein
VFTWTGFWPDNFKMDEDTCSEIHLTLTWMEFPHCTSGDEHVKSRDGSDQIATLKSCVEED